MARYLIETLFQFGFCKSYHKIIRYEKNAALQFKDIILPITEEDSFQFIADHTVTLDGRNTVHMMGMIAAISLEVTITHQIPRNEVLME